MYAETSAEVHALRGGLATVARCVLRIVLLHYSPSLQTLRGEPEGIFNVAIHVTGRDFWTFELEPKTREFERALVEAPSA